MARTQGRGGWGGGFGGGKHGARLGKGGRSQSRPGFLSYFKEFGYYCKVIRRH